MFATICLNGLKRLKPKGIYKPYYSGHGMAGKENAQIRGYNYTKDEIYKIPIRAKIITIELYEDFIDNFSDTKPSLMAQQTFNFFAHM